MKLYALLYSESNNGGSIKLFVSLAYALIFIYIMVAFASLLLSSCVYFKKAMLIYLFNYTISHRITYWTASLRVMQSFASFNKTLADWKIFRRNDFWTKKIDCAECMVGFPRITLKIYLKHAIRVILWSNIFY